MTVEAKEQTIGMGVGCPNGHIFLSEPALAFED